MGECEVASVNANVVWMWRANIAATKAARESRTRQWVAISLMLLSASLNPMNVAFDSRKWADRLDLTCDQHSTKNRPNSHSSRAKISSTPQVLDMKWQDGEGMTFTVQVSFDSTAYFEGSLVGLGTLTKPSSESFQNAFEIQYGEVSKNSTSTWINIIPR